MKEAPRCLTRSAISKSPSSAPVKPVSRISYHLKARGIEHLVFEKHPRAACLGRAPLGQFLSGHAQLAVRFAWIPLLPLILLQRIHGERRDHRITSTVSRESGRRAVARGRGGRARPFPRAEGGFDVRTSEKARIRADAVVAGVRRAIASRLCRALPSACPNRSFSSTPSNIANCNPCREGAVLVVGAGQSGAQIAEDLHLAGRRVHLAVGGAPRCARFYRGRDVVAWLADMRYYDMPVERHPLREGVRDNTNHYVTGRDGGRDIDLRQFALEGMELYGALTDFDGEKSALRRKSSRLPRRRRSNGPTTGINASIDKYIGEAGIDAPPASVYAPVWDAGRRSAARSPLRAPASPRSSGASAFARTFAGSTRPAFNGAGGQPKHTRGVTACEGVYFLGLPWLHTWGSGRFSAVGLDALYLADHIEQRLSATSRPSRALRAAG